MKVNIRTNILNPLGPQSVELLLDYIISIDEGKTAGIFPATMGDEWDIDKRDALAIPGLIDLHTHLSQFRVKGLYKDALLPWLNDYIFPEEKKSAEIEYASELADDFFRALYKVGTTTAVIYTAPYPIACETAFEAAKLNNYRAFIGMTLMDQNSPGSLKQELAKVKADCENLLKQCHEPEQGLQFILTPRFAPTCSIQMMNWIGEFARTNELWIQTHLSENKDEIKWVKELFSTDSYTAVYEKAGILTPKTILGHCIHLNDNEMNILKKTGSKIAHCPDSNFFLSSGEFPLEKFRDKGIPFAIGSDVGAGTTLNMLYHAKMFNFRQSKALVTPQEAFYRITLGSAELLGLQDKIGSLQQGKEADIVILKLPEGISELKDDILSRLVFTGHEWNIDQVYARGIRQI